NAEIDFASLEGKDVYVGATAMELRDVVAVPVYRSLPGVVVQALAAESARAGVLRNVPAALLLALLAAWAAGCTAFAAAHAWRRSAVALALALPAVWVAALYFYAAHRLVLPVVPFAVIAVGAFVAAALRSLDAA